MMANYVNGYIGKNRPEDHAEIVEFGTGGFALIGTDYTRENYHAMNQEVIDLNKHRKAAEQS